MGKTMRIALIADAFPPLRSSAAVQLRDLSLEMVRQGHKPTVMIPTPDINQPWLLEDMNGVQVMRLKAPRTKDIGYIRRTIGEFLLPFIMLRNLRKSPLANMRWDGVVWYSPTIFLGPIANALKKASACRSYLIVRDIFPEWAVDMGLLGRGLPYRFFKTIERYQYLVANVIGVQTPANLPYFDGWNSQLGRRVEVLQNWLAEARDVGCGISVAAGPLAGRTIFVYAGNMGVAQGMDILIDLAERLRDRHDIGFLFVGRGSDAQRLREVAKSRGLCNVVFYDEVEPSEIPGLYAQCQVGIVALDPRHKTHNIPGKFLTYMQGGLPVLASINAGNDLAEMIDREGVGRVCTDHSVDTLQRLAKELVDEIAGDTKVSARCRALSAKLFSPEAVVKQITAALVS
ncbi:glycosyltransferase family 4 protein [Sulfuriflexus mobilis]|uniref:glycosyltransferase family 4 protein n=1 Tax=Sulfuriflexus mobilis TaxID=1811807 RepID=UPI001E4EE2A0|nr:glycosyltransferase family 4 protein [Sulfuriflexus mobilis]